MNHLNGLFNGDLSNDRVIASGALTSSNDLGDFEFIGSGTADYSGGVLLPATGSLRFQPTAAQRKRLLSGGHIYFELEQSEGNGLLDYGTSYNPSDVKDIVSWDDGATDEFIIRRNNNPNIIMFHNGNLSNQGRLKADGESNYISVVVNWDGAKVDLYIDGLLVVSNDWPAGRDSDEFTNIYIGSPSTTGASNETSRYRNAYISDVQFQPIVQPSMRHVCAFGDSFIKLGMYTNQSSYYQILGEVPDGSSGSTFDPSASYDSGCISAAHKYLAKRNIFCGGGRIHTWHEGGTGVATSGNTLGTRIDVALNGNYPVPTMSIIHIGTNDITDASQPLTDFQDGTWKAAYQTEIDKLLAVGSKVGLCTMPPASAQTDYDSDTYRDKETAANAVIRELVAENDDVFLIDTFTAFGGHNFNSDYFGSLTGGADDRHPSFLGHRIMGYTIGKAIAGQV